jgi:hypothetical protein
VSLGVRIIAAALVALLALGAGFLLLGRSQDSPAAVKQIKPLHPVKHHLRAAPKRSARKRPTKARPVVAKKISTPSVIDGMPAALALALGTNEVVVVSLYTPRSSVDGLAKEEARQGAGLAGAGFVALDVANEKIAAPLTSLLTSGATAADRVLDDPATLIFQSPNTLFVRLNGYNDRETVAQAAENAGAVKVVAPAGSAAWANQANAICSKMAVDLLGLEVPTTSAKVLDWADQITAVLAGGIRNLHALRPPPGRAAQVAQMLAFYNQAVAGLRTLVASARAGKQPDLAGFQQKIAPLGLKADAIARDLGATSCGGSSGLLQ